MKICFLRIELFHEEGRSGTDGQKDRRTDRYDEGNSRLS